MTTYFNDKKIANVNSLQRFEKYCKNRVPEINKKYNLIWDGNEIITNDTGRISSSNRIHSYMSIWMSKDEPLLHRMIFFMVTYCEYRKIAKNYSIKFKYDKDNTIFMNYFTYLLARINIPYFSPDVTLFKYDETFLSSVCVKKSHWRTAEKILSASSGYMLKFHFECKFDEYLIADWDSSDRFQLALQFYHNFERNELIDCEIFGRIYARMLWNISTESENLIMIQKKFKLPNEIIFLILDHYELNYRQSFQFFRFKGKGNKNCDKRFAVNFPIVGQSESWSL